jgi:hypothetical protein
VKQISDELFEDLCAYFEKRQDIEDREDVGGHIEAGPNPEMSLLTRLRGEDRPGGN